MHGGGGAKCKFNDKHNKCFVENTDAATAINSIKIPHYDAAGNIIINNICIRKYMYLCIYVENSVNPLVCTVGEEKKSRFFARGNIYGYSKTDKYR